MNLAMKKDTRVNNAKNRFYEIQMKTWTLLSYLYRKQKSWNYTQFETICQKGMKKTRRYKSTRKIWISQKQTISLEKNTKITFKQISRKNVEERIVLASSIQCVYQRRIESCVFYGLCILMSTDTLKLYKFCLWHIRVELSNMAAKRSQVIITCKLHTSV